MSTKKSWIVPPEEKGERLDRFLARRLDLTRSQIRRLIDQGVVWVDGATRKAGHALDPSADVSIDVPPPAPSTVAGEPIALSIVYEDAFILVVDKPAGLVVHPGAGNPSGTLVNALVHHCPDIEGVGGERRPGLVHRLDKDTTGLLVAAKTHAAHVALTDALRRRAIRRTYQAVVWGVTEPRFSVSAPIGRDRRDRTRMRVVGTGGREAVTDGRTLRRFDFVSLVALTLQTGRTHQIRVHMAHAGFPVFGDPVYGGRTRQLSVLHTDYKRRAKMALKRIDRQALHAWRLEFDHPMSGTPLEFEAPPPDDFRQLVHVLGTSG